MGLGKLSKMMLGSLCLPFSYLKNQETTLQKALGQILASPVANGVEQTKIGLLAETNDPEVFFTFLSLIVSIM